VPVAGYFSDPDGDQLTYSGSSSSDAVATVSIEGSTATVTGVARGSAAVTITAADPDGLQASQGFNVTVGRSGFKEAAVAIVGLQDVRDRSKFINAASVAGNVSVILDVQPNDEVVTAIALTLGDHVVQCRGTSSDMSPVAGIAASGGQVAVECFLDTDAVSGACVGLQLDPAYPNGDYSLGAFLTTDEGETRTTLATLPITLKNSGFVIIAHEAGERSVVSETTKGLTFYGGPPVDGNVNLFHACPVSYGGTTVGSMQLGSIHTSTSRPPVATVPQPAEGEGLLSFRRADGAPHDPVDREAPFTWEIGTASWTGNTAVENRPGWTEYWIENRGLIANADGLDVTAEFRHDTDGDGTVETAKAGPFHFDFSAPRINYPEGFASSEIVVSSPGFAAGGGRGDRRISDGDYFSDGEGWGGPARLIVSNVGEYGVDGRNEVIAVGDCSIPANTDARASTAFVAAFDDVRNISELPEDDAVGPAGGDLSDDGGLECYFAELQALEDALGNSTWLGEDDASHRVQSGGAFGVDRTGPEVDRLTPDEPGVVVSTNEFTFEAEDPELATDEDGSGFNALRFQRFINGAWERRYDILGVYAGPAPVQGAVDVFMNIHRLEDGPHAVRAIVGDNALPFNYSLANFEFIRDTKAPTFALGSSPGSISVGSKVDAVTVTVSGSITDANVIDEALLSIYTNNGSRDICAGADAADTKLSEKRVATGTTKDLENDTNRIDFEESFLIERPPSGGGLEHLCFFLEAKDVAVHANGDDDWANTAQYGLGSFTVDWGGDESLPAVSVSDASAAEGDAVVFTVSLSAASSRQVTVEYATSDGTATSGTDFTAESGTLTFAATETSTTVSVATTDDSVVEGDETFTLTLSNPASATLGDATATGTINDNEEPGITLVPQQRNETIPVVRDNGDVELSAFEGFLAAYDVTLDARPTDDVMVTIGGAQPNTSSKEVGRDGYVFITENSDTANDNVLLFTPENYDVRQEVVITTFEELRTADYPEDGTDEAVTLTHTASGGGYTGAPTRSVFLTVIDNDWLLEVSDHDIVAGGSPVTVEYEISKYHANVVEEFYRMVVDVSNATGATFMDPVFSTSDFVYSKVAAGAKTGTNSIVVDPSGVTGAGTITFRMDPAWGDGSNRSSTGTITIKASSE